MLNYEHTRTEQIVDRLLRAERIIRIVIVLGSVLILGLFSFSISQFSVLGGLIGAAIGLAVGMYSMLLLSAVVEWMAQILVAQGEIFAELKKRE
jgi:small neutral amino acid transporter SnatA (MarC family)